MSESDLANGCKRGEMQARKGLYELYAGKMLSLCYRYTGNVDMAHDLLHDGFLRAFSIIHSFSYRGEGSLRAWLGRVFANVCLEYLRKKDLLRGAMTLEGVSEWMEDDDKDVDELPMDVLMGFVMELPAGYRTVFNLYVFEEWTHKEIARELHIKEQSSASQLVRARKLLAKRIMEYRNGIR